MRKPLPPIEPMTTIFHQDISFLNDALHRIAAIEKAKDDALEAAWADARQRILGKLPVQETGALGPWFGTVGDPKLRLLPKDLDQFSPDKVLRRWRSGVTKLRKVNPDIIGVCVVELQLCRLLDRPRDGEPRYFFEPHFHFVLYGATEEQVKAAFKVRKSLNVRVRKRALKVQGVHNLIGAVGYMTKARQEFRQQFQRKDGTLGWGRSKPTPRHSGKWHRVRSRYGVTDLLSSTGISLRFDPQP